VTSQADGFYGTDQAWIHDVRFGDLAESAARLTIGRLRAAGLGGGMVLELGCGSGISAAAFTAAGYDVVGIDLSPAMVDLARPRAPSATFTVGSLWDVEPPAELVAVTALGEVLGYVTDPRAGLAPLEALFGRLRSSLVPGGVLTFDVATAGRMGPTGAREVFHDHDDWVLRMKGRLTDDGLLERDITIFRLVRHSDGGREQADGCWRRTDEVHRLVPYEANDVTDALHGAGFTVVEERDDYDPELPVAVVGLRVFFAS